ncbi:MAG TPA: PIN domain-containing protein [Acidobacteriota bacterium]|nr:PIN domain-containing protein [Acidobacteriota bacterium]
MILVDAGPLVALIHADDQNHRKCKEALRAVREPLGTVWPVFTEAMYLLNFAWEAQEALWEMIDRAVVTLLPVHADDLPRIRALMRKYRDLPMDLADATLVRVAEREKLRRVFTTDYRHFTVYRIPRLGRFSLLP